MLHRKARRHPQTPGNSPRGRGPDPLNRGVQPGVFAMTSRSRLVGLAATALLLAVPAAAADRNFQGEFDPFPHDNSTRDNVLGTGTISATLSGNVLTVSGNFAGLSSPATKAHLEMGAAMGVPGSPIGELSATTATSGEISGKLTLNAAAMAVLPKGGLYVQLDSVKAPDGNSWAWLEEAK